MDDGLTRQQEQRTALNTSAMQSSQTLQLIDHNLNVSMSPWFLFRLTVQYLSQSSHESFPKIAHLKNKKNVLNSCLRRLVLKIRGHANLFSLNEMIPVQYTSLSREALCNRSQ